MHGFGVVLVTFAGGLAGALVLGYLAKRLKLSPIVGYLLAGIAVGPFTPGFVADRAVAEQFAEIGVILLLFGIGLRFDLKELFAVWKVALPGALIQSALSAAMLAGLLHLLGWSWTSGLILGLAISVASTVVMALVLGERHDLHSTIGHIAIGWTVVEDIISVVLLLLLPLLFGRDGGAPGGSAGTALGLAGLKIAALVVVVVVLGRTVLPRALELIARTRSRELFTLAVLVLAMGIAIVSANVFGVSMALGAFLAGLAVGRSDFAARAAGDMVSMTDAFAVMFFVSSGMLFDPKSLAGSPLVVAAVLAAVVIGKPVIAALTVRLLGRPFSVAVPVGAAFSQVGEFSFIVGTVARGLGLLNEAGWNALVAASIISIALNPFIYRMARGLSSRKKGIARAAEVPRPAAVDRRRSILVGFGPVGRIVHGLLAERGDLVTVIDLNLDTVRRMKAEGLDGVYGDALRPGTLEDAGIARAGSLILSADVEDAAEIVRYARSLNPGIRILARCSHLRDAAAIRQAGADVVAAGEAEVGVALAEAVRGDDEAALGPAAERMRADRAHLYGGGPEEGRG